MRKRPVTSASAEPGLASQEQPPLPGERSQWLPKAAVLCGSASATGNGLFLRAIIAESCDFRNPAGRARQKKDLSGLQGCPRRSPGITKLLQTCPNSVRVPLVESPLGWNFQVRPACQWRCCSVPRGLGAAESDAREEKPGICWLHRKGLR
ncbi:uncharacterized protein LOC128929916 [Callithrix jacchus]